MTSAPSSVVGPPGKEAVERLTHIAAAYAVWVGLPCCIASVITPIRLRFTENLRSIALPPC